METWYVVEVTHLWTDLAQRGLTLKTRVAFIIQPHVVHAILTRNITFGALEKIYLVKS